MSASLQIIVDVANASDDYRKQCPAILNGLGQTRGNLDSQVDELNGTLTSNVEIIAATCCFDSVEDIRYDEPGETVEHGLRWFEVIWKVRFCSSQFLIQELVKYLRVLLCSIFFLSFFLRQALLEKYSLILIVSR